MLNFRSPPSLTAALDAYIAAQPEPRPSRSEAIRRLLAEALGKTADVRSAVETDKAAKPQKQWTEAAALREVSRLDSENTPESVHKLAAIMGDGSVPEMARLKAAEAILDKGYGKPE